MTTDVSLIDGSAVVSDDGQERWTYQFGARRRPFIHPLRSPSGAVLSVDAPDDHPWHHGLWFTVKYVNGENYWEELDSYGVLRHRDDPPLAVVDTPAGTVLEGAVDWVRPDRETVVIRESRRFTHHVTAPTTYAIDFETRLTPATDVVLDRTPFEVWGGYGGLAFRGRPDFRDTILLLADGTLTERIEGIPSEGIDLSGTVEGTEAGIALIDDPDNLRSPVPWYGSTRHATYGADDGSEQWSNFVNAAFLFHEPMVVTADEPLEIRHRVVVHDGRWGVDDLTAAVTSYRRDLAR